MSANLSDFMKKTFISDPVLTDEIDLLMTLTQQHKVKPGEYVLKPGQSSTQLRFVEKGLFRSFYVDDRGEEHVKAFSAENEILPPGAAIIFSNQSLIAVQALEASSVLSIELHQLEEFLKQTNHLTSAYAISLKFESIRADKRENDFLELEAKERYQRFLLDNEHLKGRVKQKDIASFLGISQVSLSRIRATMPNEGPQRP